MPEEKDAIMCGETSPNLEPAIYPPTPATTVPSTISRPHPSAQASSEVYAKSPARLQRASERAWAALAAMQPRYEHQDPVAAATPAPPSPALGPVDAEVSDEGEQFADVEDDEEIYQFSDDGRFDIFDAALDPDVPQFDLSWGEVEADEEDIEMGQSESLPQRMNVKSSVASGRTTPKRVRFAWDIGGVGESDPGFKVWRDGY
ncbi:uncharacterized protein CcaverHIS019_0411090 [Cutaneotrichosporon cavernicola]|uniref:Uncharacterized protein n=1 Tax=Cutaneotrichosporon cavernicola TaxID=279322 RepID=A0AA48L5D3_9TREE|nr:uncharacterized protein CcaverHIS019_0411090 [Cutaneotrichosporon cavernicola]BEI92289.1 hypothetical protein CcaverHIS019_0411090 [Cutaneotrichosporon cavernicola]BEJ07833.1 hypothetical protein CcaverHIS641_0411020 [Cutaneotrichosporon cavernicola]